MLMWADKFHLPHIHQRLLFLPVHVMTGTLNLMIIISILNYAVVYLRWGGGGGQKLFAIRWWQVIWLLQAVRMDQPALPLWSPAADHYDYDSFVWSATCTYHASSQEVRGTSLDPRCLGTD